MLFFLHRFFLLIIETVVKLSCTRIWNKWNHDNLYWELQNDLEDLMYASLPRGATEHKQIITRGFNNTLQNAMVQSSVCTL